MAWLEPVELEGRHVRLRPMQSGDAQALAAASADGELWRLWFTDIPGPETVGAYIDDALAAQAAGTALPFVVEQTGSGAVVGSTRLFNADPAHRRLELGHTWYARSAQRTAVNIECKRLLLAYAFEQLQAIAVELRTHWHNHRSRGAIERLGAKQDGVLRQHRQLPDGSFRDTVVYSILDREWLAVRNGLDTRLAEHNDGSP